MRDLPEQNFLLTQNERSSCLRSASAIVDSHEEPAVVMFPTLTEDKVYFTFRLKSETAAQFLIANTQGQILFNQHVVASNFDLRGFDISTLAAGLYYVNVAIGENKYNFKLEKI